MGKTSDLIYNPVGFRAEDFPHPNAARWLLAVIYFKKVMRRLESGKWVQLRADYLKKMMGGAAYLAPVRDALVAANLIEVDRAYVRGLKSMGYRLGPALDGAVWKLMAWSGKVFPRKIQAFKESLVPTNEELGEGEQGLIYRHLGAWLHEFTLPDDLRSVFNLWEDRPDKQGQARHRAEMIRTGFLTYSVCSYGRFHSSFTGLERELRKRVVLKKNR